MGSSPAAGAKISTSPRQVTRQRAGSDILIQIVVRVVNLALGTVVTALLVRTLGSRLYGQWSTIFLVVGLVGYFLNFGIEEIAVREAARDPDREFDWLGSMMTVRLLALAPVMLVALGAVVALEQSTEMLIAGLLLVVVMPFGGFSAMSLIFRLRVDNRLPMAVLTLRSLLWGAAVLIVYLEHGTMVELAVAMVGTNVLGNIVIYAAARKMAGRWVRPNRIHVASLLRSALPVGLSGVLVLAYARIDQVIVFTVQGSKAAGLYGSIYMLLDASHFIPASILTTMAPVMAAAWPADPERLRRASRMTIELLCIGSFGALAFAVVAADPVVRLIFGPEFVPAASVLPVFAGVFVLMSVGYLTDNLVLVLGKQKRRVVIGIVALAVNLAGNLILVPTLGYKAAAWMTLLTEAICVVMAARIVMGSLEIRRLRPGRVGRAAAAAVLLGIELAVAKALGAELWALVLLACSSYPLLLLALGGVSRADVLVVIRRGAIA